MLKAQKSRIFALSIKCPNLFLFKIILNIMLFQFSYREKRIHGISGKTADGLCNNQIDFSVKSVCKMGFHNTIIADVYFLDLLTENFCIEFKQFENLR